MALEIPITCASVIALTYGDRVPAYVDAIENFIFIGTPTVSDRAGVLQCAYEMALERAETLPEEEIVTALHEGNSTDNVLVEFDEGSVSVHWETRL